MESPPILARSCYHVNFKVNKITIDLIKNPKLSLPVIVISHLSNIKVENVKCSPYGIVAKFEVFRGTLIEFLSTCHINFSHVETNLDVTRGTPSDVFIVLCQKYW